MYIGIYIILYTRNDVYLYYPLVSRLTPCAGDGSQGSPHPSASREDKSGLVHSPEIHRRRIS